MQSEIPVAQAADSVPSPSYDKYQTRWNSYKEYADTSTVGCFVLFTLLFLITGIVLLAVGSNESTQSCYVDYYGYNRCDTNYGTVWVVGWIIESIGFVLFLISCCFGSLSAGYFTPRPLYGYYY